MRAQHCIIAAAAWLIASAVFSPRACDAGFMTAEEAVHLLLDSETSSPVERPAPSPEPVRNSLQQLLASLANPSLSNAGSSTSTGATLRLTSGGVFACLLDELLAIDLPAVQRVQVQESKLLPAAYLSRVFRPPRV